MNLDSAKIADFRDAISDGDDSVVLNCTPTGLSIGAAVEIACLHGYCSSVVRSTIDRWATMSKVLASAIDALEKGARPLKANLWGTRPIDFYPIRGTDWANSIYFHPFESRFAKTAKEAGFGKFADGLAGAMHEMADNVIQHSGHDIDSAAAGIIGYSITQDHVEFAIGDLGIGALDSLKRNPTWAMLPNSKEALKAIIEKHASDRIFGGEGEGFKQVFRSIVDLNGLIELKSHDGRVRIVRTAEGGRDANFQFIGFIPGLQLSINCSLRASPGEQIIPFDNLI